MNLERVLRVTSFYLFLTGYQIRCHDRKSLHYRLTVCGLFYYLIICLLYFICFCHHFENSLLLQFLLDISPFLRDLVRIQVLLGLKVYIFCSIQNKNLTRTMNTVISNFKGEIISQGSFDISEALMYLIFLATILVLFTIGLYIAIEFKFVLPRLDHIMICIALFIPHFTLGGCVRLYTLDLCLFKRELVIIQKVCKEQEAEFLSRKSQCTVVVEVFNPIIEGNSNALAVQRVYENISKRLDFIAECLRLLDGTLQKQLCVLVGMNFNCLLAGVYAHVYFETTWKVLFTNRNSRIFYAVIIITYVCIFMDYAILLYTRWSFCRAKQNLHHFCEEQLCGNKQIEREIKSIMKSIMYKLEKKFKMNMFGLVEFNAWNFLVLQGLLILLIVVIVHHQYLQDQIKTINEQLDANHSDQEN